VTLLGAAQGAGPAPSSLTVQEHYRWYILGALGICLLEMVLIALLLMQRFQRRKLEHSLHDRVRFLGLIIELSSSQRHDAGGTDRWLQEWLQRLGMFLGLDRAAVVQARQGAFQATHWWSADAAPAPVPVPTRDFPWSTDLLRHGKTVRVSRLADLPPEAAIDRQAWEKEGIKSLLATPLIDRDRVIGQLILATCGSERDWPAEVVTHLRLVGDIFAGALVARRAETARAASERLSEILLGVVSRPTAVLDPAGKVVNANAAWVRLGQEPGSDGIPWAPLGGNYLEACGHAAAAGESPLARQAFEGVGAVLAAGREDRRLKYEWPDGHPREILIIPLHRPEGGSVVSCLDSADLERAERDAQELRQTIAHFGRVATLGELSASLAHELNQPLTAILSNVQAARRFLAAGPQNLDEIGEILSDIEDDDRRAGEVIRRLRALMRKEAADRETLRLPELVHEVLSLMSADARTRQLSIRLELDETLPPVRADRVQLSQVVLNLLLNGADAMRHTRPGERELLLRAWRYDERSVALSVRDRGTGIQAEPIERIFEPFYTSKAEGLGVGLCICQTILQAHGGRIWAANNPDHGATLHLVLPAVDGGEGR
jgi:signal transduction histidine kinase